MTRRRPSSRALAAATLAAAVVLTLTAPAGALPSTPERLSGSDRYATSAAVGAALYESPATVYIASGMNYPDALAGAALAGRDDAPLYLVGAELPAAVRDRLATTPSANAVILGGAGSVPDKVRDAVDAEVGTVSRLAGADRYATAIEISKAAYPTGAGIVVVASGEVFADALSGAPAAAAWNAPVLLVQKESIPAAVENELTRLAPSRVVVLGGEGTVSADVAAKLGAWGTVERLSGNDRYATSAAISQATHPTTSGTVVFASGREFPDALSAAAPAALLDAPLMLLATDTIEVSVLRKYESLDPDRVLVVGGASMIADSLLAILGDAAVIPERPEAQRALQALASIPAAGAPAGGYDRDAFGEWDGPNNCNTRDRVLTRDLVNVTTGAGCDVVSGTLNDPYTGTAVELQTTSSNSTIDIDHLVPLSVAWYYGANTWTDERRNDFYNDLDSLQATSATANGSKGNKTISQWLPVEAYQCDYAIRYVTINQKWGLAMPEADIDAARGLLQGC